MKKTIIALAALSTNAFAGDFSQHVSEVKKQRSDEANVNQVARLTEDMVIHYEQAVILGTSAEYEEHAKIRHFDSFLKASDEMCEDIDLATCIYDLVCTDSIPHNLNKTIMPCE